MKRSSLILALILLSYCASVKQNIINPEVATDIKSWAIISQSKLEKINSSKPADSSFASQLNSIINNIDYTSIHYNETDLIDMLKFSLAGDHKLTIKDITDSDGVISINTSTSAAYAGVTIENIYVRLLTKSGELIAQMKITNDGLGGYKKNMDSMSDLAAKKISELINSLK